MKKKFTALLLAVIMGLSFIVSAFAADTLKRVPSTIPGTDRTYNYVENITVKIPGTNVTFDFEKVADFVLVDNKYYMSHTIEGVTIEDELDIPVYHFYLFENAGKLTFNQDGMYLYSPIQTAGYSWAYPELMEKDTYFLIDHYDKDNVGKGRTFIGRLETIISKDRILGGFDIENIEEIKETAVAQVIIDMVCIPNDDYFDYERYYKFDNHDKSIDISTLDVNYTPDENYKITDGANAVANSDTKSLKITADGDFSKFTCVKVDGKTVDSSNYTVSKGSTVVEFKGEYLKTLSEGTHTVEICFTDGKAATQFEIKKGGNPSSSDKTDKPSKPNVEIPNTDGSSPVTAVFAVMALSGTAVIAYNKKKRLRK